ncbi:MAG TPA: lantibiotic dehydratase [Pseudonocardiaceae bacterium]|nr:lantibiotic dehydratase [Pseudonocardiaceae bacterium]
MDPEWTFDMTPLPGGDWSVLSPVSLRTTGLPADLLAELTWATPVDDPDLFGEELLRTSKAMARMVGSDVFREALAWQNPGALPMVESFERSAQEPGRDAKKRKREYRIARYLARYCGKTETIGFFGPVGWGRLADTAGHLTQRPGAALVGRRRTFAEPWAVRALAAALADDPEIARWLPVRRRSHHAVRDGLLYQPRSEPQSLSEVELAVLECCDGERPRVRIVAEVADALGVTPETVDASITALERRRRVVSGANVPLGPECVTVLNARLAAIGDNRIRDRAVARTAPFLSALAALESASGNADDVAAAQTGLAAAFEQASGADATRRSGQMYAGRGIAYEECLRGLDVELGADFLARVGEGLPGVLAISQWLTWRTAAVYEEHFRQAWSGASRRLDTVWFDVMNGFFGTKPKPMDGVLAEFHVRWQQLVDELHASASGWTFDPGEFRTAVARLFPSPGPGWPAAAIHSPDLQLVSRSLDGVRTGDYDVVLSEIHISVPTTVGPVFEWSLGEDYPLSRFLRSRIGPEVVPAFPDSWPRNTGRTMPALPVPGDLTFAFADVTGAPAGTVPMTAVQVGVADGAVYAELANGNRLAFRDFFSYFLSAVVLDGWKGISAASHAPRMAVGRFVIARETWRVDVGGQPFTRPAPEFDSYREVDTWRRELGCPDRVYVKLPSEVKPFYVDFRSPISVLSFLAALRSAVRQPNAPSELTLSEALPEPEQAWVVDDAGSTYFGEVRMVVMTTPRT